jgi:hypothetical protein
LPLLVAVSAQSWIDAIYFLGLLVLIGQSSCFACGAGYYKPRTCTNIEGLGHRDVLPFVRDSWSEKT